MKVSKKSVNPVSATKPVSAVILAAGLSRRMGSPKMILPWGSHTIVGHVVHVLREAGIDEIVVVVGGARQQVEAALADYPVRTVFNPRFTQDDMTVSLQVGLRVLSAEAVACLVVLGDQPQIEADVVNGVVSTYRASGADLVIPSYQMRRGHPWLVARSLWDEMLELRPSDTLRAFINRHADEINYLMVDSSSVLKDLDTPGDYERERPSPAS